MRAEFSSPLIQNLAELKLFGVDSCVVAIGVFDGVHRGHVRLLEELRKMSDALSACPVAMTFFPHPRVLVDPAHAPELLLPPEEKARLLMAHGAKAVLTQSFTKEFAALAPEEFLQKSLFVPGMRLKGLCVGSNWHFGRDAEGNAAFLEKMSEKYEFAFTAVKELCTADGSVISSTSIRNALKAGDLSGASGMLGRNYTLFGTVEKGYHVAGTELGTPTANMHVEYAVLPPDGVYAALVHIGSETFEAAMNVGTSPTFRERYGKIAPRIELHLLRSPGRELYGLPLSAELCKFIRPEKRFENTDLLKQQIAEDITAIQSVFLKKERTASWKI